ncbi:MAG: hypothetical protein KTR16_05895 [Acidiferrobacterales bacterium]|nr:hypothetical protein [Acidiferrobacterales bacterium]
MAKTEIAATFYLDSIYGDPNNSGDQNSPWRTLQEVIESILVESQEWQRPYSSGGILMAINSGAPIKAGDTLIQISGYHNKIDIHRYIK